MSRVILLGVLLAVGGIWTTRCGDGRFDPEDRTGRGAETCVRCGGERVLRRSGTVETIDESEPSAARAWAENLTGPCRRHAWKRSGFWESQEGSRLLISCFVPTGHSLWGALAHLDDAPSRDVAKRFAALPEDSQTEMWRLANSTALPWSVEGHEREVARAVAESAEWKDLAAAWPP